MSESIPLPSRNRLIELFDYDAESGYLTWRVSRRCVKAGSRAGHKGIEGYRQVRVDGIAYQEHRIIFRICTAIDAGDFTVDHANRVRNDNRISNLRLATHPQQRVNQNDVNGYCFRKSIGQYKAAIRVDDRVRHLGYWPTEEIACAIYATAAARIHGEFAPEPPPNPFGFVNTHWGKCSDGSHKGVSFYKATGKWQVTITIDGKRKYLGYFPTKEEARRARLAAEAELAAV